MTRVQRELHRRIWLSMLVLVPLLCGWALHMRSHRASVLRATAEARP